MLDPVTGRADLSQAILLGSLDFSTPLKPFTDPTTPGTSDELPVMTLTVPTATTAGTWYLYLYADDLRTVSELHEDNNITPGVAITIIVDLTPPVIAAHADVTVNASSANGAVVTYTNPTAVDAVDGPVAVICTPPSGSLFPIGTTTVTCTASDSHGNTAVSSFAVIVALRYGFVGVQNLPPPAGKAFNTGSSVPLKWQFTLGGAAVDSSAADPKIVITGPAGSMVFTPEDPGKSSFQPPTAANGWTWQFNWQTVDNTTGASLPAGTYSVSVSSQVTGQTFNGGQITLK